MKHAKRLIGPFKQVVTMNNLPLKGALRNDQLEIIEDGGILINNGKIEKVDTYNSLKKGEGIEISKLEGDFVALPGFIDCHTHICYGGSRYLDFEDRNSGVSYIDIAKRGGGIWSTVKHTRAAEKMDLIEGMILRLDRHLKNGITTVEVKSGYGLSVSQEVKMLKAIRSANEHHVVDLIPTCLAAHIVPKEFSNECEYLNHILKELVPMVKEQKLCSRFDIFIEESAFSAKASRAYLKALNRQGFDITVHGDQFTPIGSTIAIECGAVSVDHLEASTDKEILAIADSNVVAAALPGASIGLGCSFAPARKLLDAGASLAIASDWNPGSAPQGNLLSQASILATFEKLSAAEVLSGITYRAAKALALEYRGRLSIDYIADIVAFPCNDFREILYSQGELYPSHVWKNGDLI
ncbi:MAG: imidazolonepropionase [Saprospiraceae bacterium]